MKITAALTIVLLAAVPAAAQSALLPVTQFMVQDIAGQRSLFTPPPYTFGLVQVSTDFQETDEVFIEFNLAAFTHVESATLEFKIVSPPPGNIVVARTFDLSYYAGSGAPDAARLGQGVFLQTFFAEAQPSLNQGTVKQVSLDVTSQVQALLNGGTPIAGFRMHNPINITPGGDTVPVFEYWYDHQYNQAQLVISVPEPPMSALALAATTLLANVTRSRRRAVRVYWSSDCQWKGCHWRVASAEAKTRSPVPN